MDKELMKVQKLYGNRAMFFAIIIAFILVIIGEKAIGKGLILGTLFSIVNFVIMGMFLGKQISGAEKPVRARSTAFLSLFARLVMLAVPLLISLKSDTIDFFGTVVGIFMIQLTILFSNLIIDRFSNVRKA